MQCPKCHGRLEDRTYGRRITVKRCEDCQGLWCKRETLATMKTEWMSEALDIGEASTGRRFNEIRDVPCPECGETLTRVPDERQRHIWLDACPSCDGVWFDAGEFTDWKHETLMDVLRDMLASRGRR